MSAEGYIRTQSPIKPANDNPRGWAAEVLDIKGAPIICAVIDDLIAHHPNRMMKGSSATVHNYPTVGTITEYRLAVDPSQMINGSGDSVVTLNNFTQFWELSSQVQTATSRVYQYAPDGPGGGAPVFPYTVDTESNWSNVLDKNKGHRWMRFRDDDVDSNHDGIFDNWTPPVPINSAFASGDYVDARFRRQNVSATVHTSSGTLSLDKYYSVESGKVQIDGDLSLNDIGQYGTETTATLTIGRVFKYASGNTYTFLSSASVVETLKAPPRTINGAPNNEPSGWDDTVPSGSAQLWKISGQKSVRQQLKSDWLIEKVIENPNYTRYSEVGSPHPDTIVDTNTSAADSTGGDTALIAAGWVKVYDGQTYIARRKDSAGPDLYTAWLVEKILDESGEYTDHVFKLFSVNLDVDSPDIAAPTHRDPSDEGWYDTPQPETDIMKNYVSQARKFFSGELKTSWSPPVPWTGADTYNDVIITDLGDNFKYDSGGVVTPAQITLQANLYKGLSKLWENPDVDISYQWKKVYDGGSVVDVSPSTNPADDFYRLGADDSIRADQRVVIKPGAVDGNAVFRCTQTVIFDVGDPLVFEEEISILDVTDGKDSKSLALAADNDRIIWDTVNSVFSPLSVILRAYQSNLVSPTFYWYKKNGASWDSLTSDPDYTIATNTLSFDPADIFAHDSTGEEITIAVSTHASNPDSADFINTFSDYRTITKLSSAGTGSAGENAVSAILSNEAHLIQLNGVTLVPLSGEIGSSGKALTKISVYDGQTKLIYSTDYSLGLADDSADVTFAQAANGNDANVYVNTWINGARRCVCTITITYGSFIFTKQFSLSTALDAPGAIILDVDSDKGFIFTPDDKTNKTLTARLYDTSLPGNQLIALPDAHYEFRWKINNVFGSLSTTPTKVVTTSDIATYNQVVCEVYKDAVLYRSRTIAMGDVNDGRTYRAWTDSTSVSGSQKLTSQDPQTAFGSGVIVSGVTWRLATDTYWATHTPVYAQDAQGNGGTWSWGPPYRIKGEQGDQGIAGAFPFRMYIASPTEPAFGAGGSSSSLAQMQSAGWTARIPATGIIWYTERMWDSNGVTFDGDAYPSTGPLSGSTWLGKIRLTGTNGTNGVGTNGVNGWSPQPSLVNGSVSGTKVIQINWIGGTGAKPTVDGLYVTAGGLSSNLAAAIPVTGTPVEMRFDSTSGFIQWKYQTEDGTAWRNLVAGNIGQVVYQSGNISPIPTFTILNFGPLPSGKYMVQVTMSADGPPNIGFFGISRSLRLLAGSTGMASLNMGLLGNGFGSGNSRTLTYTTTAFMLGTGAADHIVFDSHSPTGDIGGAYTNGIISFVIYRVQ